MEKLSKEEAAKYKKDAYITCKKKISYFQYF